MKILILMPCDEQHTYMATGIYKELSEKNKAVCFAVPMYMQYLMDTKIVDNWTAALCYSLLSARVVYDGSKNKDLIIIGNCNVDREFDAVFNFQEDDEALEYKDYFLEKIREICEKEQPIMRYVDNVHTKEESLLALKNIKATAHFIDNYMETEPELNKIEEQYKQAIEYVEGNKDGISSIINGSNKKE